MTPEEWKRFKARIEEWIRTSTVEARLEQLEKICLRTDGVSANRCPGNPPPRHSRAWYAEEILFHIRVARVHLSRGEGSLAAGEALEIGVLAAEAARLSWPEVQTWHHLSTSESKDRALVHKVGLTVALAGQVYRDYDSRQFGIDSEIEFYDDNGALSGRRAYLQLKSGESHLTRRKRDSAEIFRLRTKDAEYWVKQAYPVFLIIADSQGRARWMEVRELLKQRVVEDGSLPRSLVFAGKPFDVEAVTRCRITLLSGPQTQLVQQSRRVASNPSLQRAPPGELSNDLGSGVDRPWLRSPSDRRGSTHFGESPQKIPARRHTGQCTTAEPAHWGCISAPARRDRPTATVHSGERL